MIDQSGLEHTLEVSTERRRERREQSLRALELRRDRSGDATRKRAAGIVRDIDRREPLDTDARGLVAREHPRQRQEVLQHVLAKLRRLVRTVIGALHDLVAESREA